MFPVLYNLTHPDLGLGQTEGVPEAGGVVYRDNSRVFLSVDVWTEKRLHSPEVWVGPWRRTGYSSCSPDVKLSFQPFSTI